VWKFVCTVLKMCSSCWTSMIRSSCSTIMRKFKSKVPLQRLRNLSLSLRRGLWWCQSRLRGLDMLKLARLFQTATTEQQITRLLACFFPCMLIMRKCDADVWSLFIFLADSPPIFYFFVCMNILLSCSELWTYFYVVQNFTLCLTRKYVFTNATILGTTCNLTLGDDINYREDRCVLGQCCIDWSSQKATVLVKNAVKSYRPSVTEKSEFKIFH
jgi:hypothetical protein